MKIKILPWVIWFLATFFVLYQFILQSANSVMAVGLLNDLHISLSQLGFLSSSFFYFYVILQIPAGLLVDRFGAKRMLLTGLLLCIMATASFGLIHTFAAGISCRLLMGIGSSVAVVGVMYLSNYWFPKALFSLLATMAESITILGGAIGETSLSHLVGHFSWRNTMLCAAGIGLFLWLLILFIVQDRPDYNKPIEIQHSLKIMLMRFIIAVQCKNIWLAGLFCGFSFSFIINFGSMWSIPFLQKVYAYSLTQAAHLSSFIFISAALGAWVFGYAASYLKKTRLLMGLAGTLAMLATTAIFFIPLLPFKLLLAMFFLGGLGSGSYVLSFIYIKQNTYETICASAMGFTNMMCLAPALILQPLIGSWLTHYAGYGLSPFWLYQKSLCPLIGLQLLGVIAVLLMRKE